MIMILQQYCCGRRVMPSEHIEKSNEASTHTETTEEIIEVLGDQFDQKPLDNNFQIKSLDLWYLALTTAVAGHYLTWNEGLSAGFGSYLIALGLIASAFVCLVCCIAELSSALPFAGGAYGIARVTLGIFPGYLVACSDTYKSIISASSAAVAFGNLLTIVTGASPYFEPLYWFIFYGSLLSMHILGAKVKWQVITTLSLISLVLLFVYLLGSAQSANLPKYAPLDDDSLHGESDRWFRDGMTGFMHILPVPCWFYIGIQSINLASGEMVSPKTEVPKAYIASLCTTLLTSFSVLLTACALYPGTSALRHRLFPLTRGYMIMFDLPRHLATIVSIPAMLASGFGFMYFFGQQLRAMGQSGLLNPVFAWELPGRRTPAGALLIGSLLGYALCVLVQFEPGVRTKLYDISIMGALATYLSIFVSFWQFRTHFPTIKREFVSPLGRAGAVWGFLVFMLALIGVCGFQKTRTALIVFLCIISVASVYYYLVVQKREVFSEEEKIVMFKAYLIKGNAAKTGRIRRGNAAGGKAARTSSHLQEGGARKPPPVGLRRIGKSRSCSSLATPSSTATRSTVVSIELLESEHPAGAAVYWDIECGREQRELVSSPAMTAEYPIGGSGGVAEDCTLRGAAGDEQADWALVRPRAHSDPEIHFPALIPTPTEDQLNGEDALLKSGDASSSSRDSADGVRLPESAAAVALDAAAV